MLDEQLITRALYGGAIEMDIPKRLEDVSDFRPVPDNQEVWTDASLDQSLIVEIVEHQAVSDQDCMELYYRDLAQQNQAASWQVQVKRQPSEDEAPKLLSHALRALVMGCQRISKGRQATEADNVQVQLAIFRFPERQTDILISVNTPISISADSEAAQHAGSGRKSTHLAAPQLFISMLKTFNILDYSLFG